MDTRCFLLKSWRMEEETHEGDETGLSIQTLLMRIQRLSTHHYSSHAPQKRNRTLPSQQPNHLTSLFHSFLSCEEWSPQHPSCDHWWYKGTRSESFHRFHHSIPIIELSLHPLFIPRFGSKYALITNPLQSSSTQLHSFIYNPYKTKATPEDESLSNCPISLLLSPFTIRYLHIHVEITYNAIHRNPHSHNSSPLYYHPSIISNQIRYPISPFSSSSTNHSLPTLHT